MSILLSIALIFFLVDFDQLVNSAHGIDKKLGQITAQETDGKNLDFYFIKGADK